MNPSGGMCSQNFEFLCQEFDRMNVWPTLRIFGPCMTAAECVANLLNFLPLHYSEGMCSQYVGFVAHALQRWNVVTNILNFLAMHYRRGMYSPYFALFTHASH